MSRRRRSFGGRRPGWAFVLILLAGVALVAGLPYAIASRDAQRPPPEPRLAYLTLPQGLSLADLEPAQVEEIIDGDTIEVSLGGQTVRVRYYGIDTPERGRRCYREAKDRNESLLGETVLLLPDARDRDAGDRSLRYVFREDGLSLDATLVAEGFALAWRAEGRYRAAILDLEAEAMAAGRGCLWR